MDRLTGEHDFEEMQRVADTIIRRLEDPEVKRSMTILLRRYINRHAVLVFNDLLTAWSVEYSDFPDFNAREFLRQYSNMNENPNSESDPNKENVPAEATVMDTSSEPCLPTEIETLETKMERMEKNLSNEFDDAKIKKGKKRGPQEQWDNMMDDLQTSPLEDGEKNKKIISSSESSNSEPITVTTSPGSLYLSPLSSTNVSPWSQDSVDDDDDMGSSAFSMPIFKDSDTPQPSLISSGFIDESKSSSHNSSKSDSVDDNSDMSNYEVSKAIEEIVKSITISLGDELKIEETSVKVEKQEHVIHSNNLVEMKISPGFTSTSFDKSEVTCWPMMDATAENNGLISPQVHEENVNTLNSLPTNMLVKRDHGDDQDSAMDAEDSMSKKRKLTYDHWIPDHVVSAVNCTPQKIVWNKIMSDTGTWPIRPNFNNWTTNLVFNNSVNPSMSTKRKRPLSDDP